jgi:hypothetical protein
MLTVKEFFEFADRFKFWNEMERTFPNNPPKDMYQGILDKCRVEAVELGIIIKVSLVPGGTWFCVKAETVDGEAGKTFVL